MTRRRRILGEDHPDSLFSANNLAIDLRLAGDYEQAREIDQEVLSRRRRILGPDHPDTLFSASNLAHDLRELGRYTEAAHWVRKGLALEPNDSSMQKLEFRLRVLKIRSKVLRVVRKTLGLRTA